MLVGSSGGATSDEPEPTPLTVATDATADATALAATAGAGATATPGSGSGTTDATLDIDGNPITSEESDTASSNAGDAPINRTPTARPLRLPNTGADAPAPGRIRSSQITRLVIPGIMFDVPVNEIGWDMQQSADGSTALVWQVSQDSVGHHDTSAIPGDNDNIVLTGHVGGVAMVFRHLDKVQPGSRLFLTSAGRVHEYIVTRVHIIEEQDASPRQQNNNLSYIEPTTHEVVTLLSCWPPTGPRQYSQRIIVQAVPYVISTAY